MTTKMNLNGTTRKALVAAIVEITGEKAIYRAMPACSYDIGGITVTKDLYGCKFSDLDFEEQDAIYYYAEDNGLL